MDKEKKEGLDKKWQAIAAKAVTDDEFKKKLVAKPVEVMLESGLTLPEGAEMKLGAGKVQTLYVPSRTPSDELKEEVKWWRWRLDSIREFGREKPEKTVGHLSMSSQEADDDSSGMV